MPKKTNNMKSPCELIVWHLLPAIRSELVKSLKEENIPQKDSAKHLGMTPAGVSLYISGKRGNEMPLPDEIKLKIKDPAKRIISEDMTPFEIMKNICPICVEARKTKILCGLHKKSDKDLPEECDFWKDSEKCFG